MMKHFIQNHRDVLEILLAGGGGIGLMLTELELTLKILIGFATLGFILYKWRCAYLDRNKK